MIAASATRRRFSTFIRNTCVVLRRLGLSMSERPHLRGDSEFTPRTIDIDAEDLRHAQPFGSATGSGRTDKLLS